MKKYSISKILLFILACWLILVSVESYRLIGSEEPGKAPMLVLGSSQIQDKLAEYDSIGFSQVYHLSDDDSFVNGEFYVLGIRIAQWENKSIPADGSPSL